MTQSYVPSVDSVTCHFHGVTNLVCCTLDELVQRLRTYLWAHEFAAGDRLSCASRFGHVLIRLFISSHPQSSQDRTSQVLYRRGG